MRASGLPPTIINFRHKNVLKYTRPELVEDPENITREEMTAAEKMMIERWNSVVGPEDLVYYLGDFTLNRGPSLCKYILEKLHGARVILLKGNHDRKTKAMEAAGFAEVHSRLFLNQQNEGGPTWHTTEPIQETTFLELHHYPATVTNKFPAAVGHAHNTWKLKGPGTKMLQWDRQQKENSPSIILKHPLINVSVENWNYTPLALSHVIALLDDPPPPPLLI